jgi:hypothetical protein
MRTSFTSFLALAVLVSGTLACKGAEAGAGDAKDPFVVKAALEKSPDGTGRATVAIQVAAGWHWNAEYPFKLVVNEQQGTALAKTAFAGGDVKVAGDGGAAQIDLGGTGPLAGDARMKGVINFGVCEAKVCRFCRNCAVEWTTAGSAP